MSQRGSTLPLIAGALALTVALVVGVVSATSLIIERHRLVALAEATALRAAESFDPARLRRGAEELIAPLDNARVNRAAREFLATTPAHAHTDLRLIRADTPDGRRARVILQSTWQAPVWSQFLPVTIPVRAEASSRAVIR